jgi:hypothetical protein
MRRLPKGGPTTAIRLDYPDGDRAALDYAAVIDARLSVASYARLAIELLVKNGKVTKDDVKSEADRRLGEGEVVTSGRSQAKKKPKRT